MGREEGLTKAITIIALTCFLVAGVAVTSILSRTSMEASVAAMPAPVVKSPVANREAKQDRLSVVRTTLAAVEPSEIFRQAYASSSAADVEAARAVAALPKPASQPATAASAPDTAPVGSVPAPAKPKVVAKPAPQKSYALLSDAQIAGIKERLRLTSDQEYYWPGIENALHGIARKIHAARQHDPNATAAQIDPDSAEVSQLKSAAMPLLFQLREDQKDEVRKLARIIGLEKVASAI
jgi:uncharacterized membrane protein